LETTLRKLDASQVEAFDEEYVDDSRWGTVTSSIDQDFPGGEFTFLDLGGGNGMFADRMLAAYPRAKGTVLDNSEVLVSRNQPNERKTVILDSVENVAKLGTEYDIIFLNWLLHHVVGDSYAQTRRNQLWTLCTVHTLLTERGRVSVFENLYEGLLIENLPGWIIYELTSNRAITGITRGLGANTAGVGVCFLSKNQWLSTMQDARLKVLRCTEPDAWTWSLPLVWKICLHIRRRFVGHFWLGAMKSPSGNGPSSPAAMSGHAA
jgi:hypothetical protein